MANDQMDDLALGARIHPAFKVVVFASGNCAGNKTEPIVFRSRIGFEAIKKTTLSRGGFLVAFDCDQDYKAKKLSSFGVLDSLSFPPFSFLCSMLISFFISSLLI